jgi:hypothetical protein
MLRNFLNVIAFVTLPLNLFSTCIIIARSKDVIYVAADSKSVFHNMNGKYLGESQILKINNVGNRYFAVTGHDEQFLTPQATRLLKLNEDLNKVIRDFCETVKKHYQLMMASEKKTFPSDYNYYLHNSLSNIAFFGFKNNSSYLKNVEFSLIQKGSQDIIRYSIVDSFLILPLGIHDHLDKLSPEQMINTANNSDQNNIQIGLGNLVQYELIKHEDYIGCPIHLLKLTKEKAQWSLGSCHN